MHPDLEEHLTEKQFRKICHYWQRMEKLKQQLDRPVTYRKYTEYMHDELIEETLRHNEHIRTQHENIHSLLQYFETEYSNYVESLGYHLSDASQPEALFHLLNNGMWVEGDIQEK
jgi:hypothetical protein